MTSIFRTSCYICMDPSVARMGLPLCRECPKCGGHIAADDSVCDDCGWDTHAKNHRYHPHRSKGLRPKQRVECLIRCPVTHELAINAERVVEMAKWQPYGQSGRSFEVKHRVRM